MCLMELAGSVIVVAELACVTLAVGYLGDLILKGWDKSRSNSQK